MTQQCTVRRAVRALIISVSFAGLAACGGGGGGGGTGTATPAPAPPTAPPPPTPVGPSVGAAEYQQSWGVAGVKARGAWDLGHSGQGVTVAVIDSGVDGNSPDLVGRVSAASTDINATRNQLVGANRHGTEVAGVIAARHDGQGAVGVAFNATVLSVRADNGSGSFNTNDLARAIDYAVAQGAKVINLSLGSSQGAAGPAFEAALQRAVDAGVIFAMAAGNDGVANAYFPSAYNVDPRYAGSIIAVGSINQADQRSAFSNAAGGAQNLYLMAPGEGVVADCNGVTCSRVSGTSYAAPHVAGAMALVLQAFPNLSGRAGLDLLLRTARDLGAPGTDDIYGRGALDLARAFAPVGSLAVPTEGGETVLAASGVVSMIGAPFGDAVGAAGALGTVGWDFYQRPFPVDMAMAYGGARPSILAAAPADRLRQTEMEMVMPGGGRLALAAGMTETAVQSPASRFRWMPEDASREVTLTYRSGRLGLTAWSGSATSNPFASDIRDPFTALAGADRAVRVDYAAGRWLVSAEGGAGQRRSPDLLQRDEGASYVRVSGQTRIGAVASTLTFGRLAEPLGPLGAYIPAGSGLTLPSTTTFAAWAAAWPLGERFTLHTEASLGRTDLDGRFLALEDAAWSTAWRAALSAPCASFGLAGCADLRLTLAQPLRIESGRFVARLADVPAHYFGPVGFSERRFEASPSGRQMDLTLSVTRRSARSGLLQLDAVASSQAGHRRSSAPAYGLLASWRAGF